MSQHLSAPPRGPLMFANQTVRNLILPANRIQANSVSGVFTVKNNLRTESKN